MNSSWNGVNKVVGAEVQYTCDAGGFFGDLNATVNITCEESGNWTEIDPEIFFCKIPVPGDLPPIPPGAIMVAPDPPYWVPAAISFICRENQLSPLSTTNYTIFGNEICQDDPFEAPERAESSWNGFSKTEGIQVQYTCEEDHVFADFNATLNITCGGDGNWTSVDRSILICRIPIPCDPPPAPPGATMLGEPPYWAGSLVTYVCGENQAFPNSGRAVNVSANATGWPEMGPDFMCYNACQALPELPDHVSHNLTGTGLWGDVVQYECRGIFADGSKNITDSCELGNWTLSVIPVCECCSMKRPTETQRDLT
ncbi:sushi, von Willebrand factor type A, EGF and pentraxin domain-containing protein 1-like [Penaeus chinensis]|uniref:sushi, von Willebrand factor type A, EGF and pentraxin domain-containing protein 1-like n=1 Tax=Penaeus chinensis TaxID=139456 RepID=UPI001FB7980B|nr:sushi, von Willebrand factor type A, EGF and pentraxin domain-containing protein 1-like [Penaeus chinensis]